MLFLKAVFDVLSIQILDENLSELLVHRKGDMVFSIVSHGRKYVVHGPCRVRLAAQVVTFSMWSDHLHVLGLQSDIEKPKDVAIH